MSGRSIRNAEVVTVGDELLLGVTADANFVWLASRLAEAGVRVDRQTTVGDGEEEIRRAVDEAAARSPLVVVTGGLGVTPDDRTRQALADLAGVRLIPDPALIREMEVYHRDRRIRMPAINVAQASLPEGARKIPNRVGLAPGLRMKIRKATVFVFPGVPAEMRQLTEDGLIPYLRRRNGEAPIRQKSLRTWGIGENALAEKLRDYLARERPVSISFLPERRGVTLRFRLHEGVEGDPEGVLAMQTDEAAAILGDLVYSTGGEELEEVVAYLLLLRKRTVATAESCTGGRLADLLTSVPGSSAWFREGFIPYGAERKKATLGVPEEVLRERGTVSAETAEELARRVRALSGADIGVGVTGVAGPESVENQPVGRVFIALDARGGTIVRRWDLPGSRDRVKDRAARHALDMIRLHLIAEEEGGG
ncbi:MAG: competence/damage-inducible protein A [Candidatus Eisenbacteria bacterium]|nr:competence/damage-inducible protein A [Candidatus Eisenbacteria bacterium]